MPSAKCRTGNIRAIQTIQAGALLPSGHSPVMRLCDPVIVLDRGKHIAAGPPTDVQANKLVLDAYLGS
jgi:ABC-type branched-subunit amino acid transport system ATPase component